MIVAFIILAIEFPLPFIKGRAIHRSIPLRIVMLVFQASLAILFYQVRFFCYPFLGITTFLLKGTNCAIWSLIAAGCYGRAQALGEIMEDAKANKGKVERA
jgi:hypothetical protein